MLKFLRIRDFALIRELEMEFKPGLNLLTGETGSGKSIIVDALGLLVGDRTSSGVVRSGCEAAIIEGVFSAEKDGRIPRLLNEAGIPGEDSLIIRREIPANGRGRVFVNDSLATLSTLKSIGESLADIHGQQDQHSLLDLSNHLTWLDRFGRNEEAVGEVRRHYLAVRDTSARLDALETNEQERRRRMDVLRFQLEEIRSARLRPQEKEELEKERRILANRERIFSLATEAYGILYESDHSTVGQVKRLQRLLLDLEAFDNSWAPHREFAGDALYRLEDLAFSLRDYTATMDFSPNLIDQVERRLAEVERLTGKYGQNVEEVLAFADRCERELEELGSFEETSEALTRKFDSELKLYREAAASVSDKRRRDAARLRRELAKELHHLALEKTRIDIYFAPPPPASAGRIPPGYGAAGLDRVELLASPNVGEELKPLAKIASGGELSRVMLAIKSLCGGDEPGKALVFDEVDAGIGGRVAQAVGRRLRGLAATSQVLCVTHLPQIAAFAHQHFCVTKKVVGSRTETFVQLLAEKERIEELARMMGGQDITEITRRHAQELLREVSAEKQGRRDSEGRA